MIPNRITNEKHASVSALYGFYQQILLDFWETEIMRSGNRFRVNNLYSALKLICNQYVETRQILKSMDDLRDVIRFIDSNHLRILNVPLNLLDDRRKPTAYQRFEIENLKEVEHDTNIRICGDIEEPIVGKGWEGDCRIFIPYRTTRYDDTAIRYAFASYGFYLFDTVYTTTDDGRFLDSKLLMRSSDFAFTIDTEAWMVEESDDDDDLDPDDDGHFTTDRIRDIEEGLLDDEDDRL